MTTKPTRGRAKTARAPRARAEGRAKGPRLVQKPITTEAAAKANAHRAHPLQLSTADAVRFFRERATVVMATRNGDAIELDEVALDGATAWTVSFLEGVVAASHDGPPPDGRADVKGPSPTEPRYWLTPFANVIGDAALDVMVELVGAADLTSYGTNTLSVLGNLVSTAVRRRVLLALLERLQWNMAQVAEILRLGTSTHVKRAIKELSLEREHQAAKDAGLIKVGGRRPRLPTPRATDS